MQVDVGTSEVELDTSDYPDTGAKGQTLIVQNLGGGDLYVDTVTGVLEGIGIKIAANGYWEFPDWSKGNRLFMVASEAGTDVRFMVTG